MQFWVARAARQVGDPTNREHDSNAYLDNVTTRRSEGVGEDRMQLDV